jgi:general L-amino acid transport system permease protein
MRSFWNDVEIWAWIYQLLVIVTVIGIGAFLISNAQDALRKQGISTGFDFLLSTAEFDIGEKSIPFHTTDTFLRAYGVALINTLKVSAVSIILATLIGVLVGVGRLSPHFLVRRLSSIYVEVFRNTPQLVQLIFWYTVITNLPGPRNAISIVDVAFLSNRGFSFPWPSDTAALACVAGALLAGLGMGLFAARILEARRRRTGRTQPIWIWSLILVLGPPAAVWLSSDSSILLTVPQRRGFNFQGGLTISPEFLALLLGLSLYIGAFIAEIVRSGIQSVGRGQIEAARSIGLGTFDTYRKVIFPQALRVIVPPATGQYVSLVKNSSLGVAIGYPEMFSVNNTIITLSGHTVEAIAIMMSIYLAISFVIAAMMNVYNRFVQIKER